MSTGLYSVNSAVKKSEQFLFTPACLEFLRELEKKFGPRRKEILSLRIQSRSRFKTNEYASFLEDTEPVRGSEWKVTSVPADLNDRRVEITGPAESKMMINALNSGARVFMADMEDALSPTWSNVIEGQKALYEAVRRTLSFSSPEGKEYKLNEKIATLVVRPRGWHLEEKNVRFNDQPVSGSLFDFGIYFYWNAQELLNRGSGPYFYLPKMESHLEARLWSDVFKFSEDYLKIKRSSIKSTVLIETLPAAFEMEEILYELKDYIVALNAGRWDYLFSSIKMMSTRSDIVYPDRAQLTMTVPFMKAYCELLVSTCHKRGAHAIGGMAAFIPSRKDPEINQVALAKVREDKLRESTLGFDGTWVAHPDLVPVAEEIFNEALKTEPHQKSKGILRVFDAKRLAPATLVDGKITESGVRNNLNVALHYITCWLGGLGAVAIHNLMEDAATAEISRAEVWHWVRHHSKLEDGRTITTEIVEKLLNEEHQKLESLLNKEDLEKAKILLRNLVLGAEFVDFLTLPAYQQLK